MEIFLVRHGQTNGNVSWRHQHVNTPLNEEGERQANELINKLRDLNPTHLISSPNVRALETAKIISEAFPQLTIDIKQQVKELERPDFLIGNHYLSFTTFRYIFTWFYGKSFSSGESYQAFLTRMKEVKDDLETLPNDARVILVTHSIFTTHFTHFINKEKRMSLVGAVVHLWRVLRLPNTAITKIEVQKGKNNTRWCLGECS